MAFAELTGSGIIRQGAFLGLRADKPAEDVVRETPRDAASGLTTSVTLTHPDRLKFADMKLTKADVVRYYADVAAAMLPFLRQRPITLLRCPSGNGGACFYQKHHTGRLPPSVHAVKIRERKGERDYVFIEDFDGIVACVQLGTLEFHPWGAFVDDIERPERIIIDLDPDPDVGFEPLREGAFALRQLIEALGLRACPMLSGGKGLHVIVPLTPWASWDDVSAVSHRIASLLEEAAPQRFLTNMSKAKRKGRIFVDYLRNKRGATAIAPYSTRARAGAPAACPIDWKELEQARSLPRLSLTEIAARVRSGTMPWPDYEASRQKLTRRIMASLGL